MIELQTSKTEEEDKSKCPTPKIRPAELGHSTLDTIASLASIRNLT